MIRALLLSTGKAGRGRKRDHVSFPGSSVAVLVAFDVAADFSLALTVLSRSDSGEDDGEGGSEYPRRLCCHRPLETPSGVQWWPLVLGPHSLRSEELP